MTVGSTLTLILLVMLLQAESRYQTGRGCSVVEVGDKDKKYLKERCGSRFKCPNSDVHYTVEPYRDDEKWNRWSPNCTLKYDKICPHDNRFYQVCGHALSKCEELGREEELGSDGLFCRSYTCIHKNASYPYTGEGEIEFTDKILSGLVNFRYADCNEELTCYNTVADERGCEGLKGGSVYVCQGETNTTISSDKVCDLNCDCYRCNDEAVCNNRTYGVNCDSTLGKHIHPMYMCDNNPNCFNKEDESTELCGKQDIIRWCVPGDVHGPDFYNHFPDNIRPIFPHQICAVPRYVPYPGLFVVHGPDFYNHFPNNIRPIFPHQICAVPRLTIFAWTCKDGLDQINCSDSSRVALSCLMHSKPTTISFFAVCQDFQLCDDGYHNRCFEVEKGCRVHKNQVCDGVRDCPDNNDESEEECGGKFLSTQTCVRRVHFDMAQQVKKPIPLKWVMDGERDCENGIDENPAHWQQCGPGRYVERGVPCEDVFLCPDNKVPIEFQNLCDKVTTDTCVRENEICAQSRDMDVIWTKVLRRRVDTKILGYCLAGMRDLHRLTGRCVDQLFEGPNKGGLGVTNLHVRYPVTGSTCNSMYGELYVYMACTRACQDATCPLKAVEQDSCVNVPYSEKVYTLTQDYKVTVVHKEKGGYYKDYFSCDNKKCIPFSQVCNLANDCGDDSDEANCTNHHFCSSSREYIPLTKLCDGEFDCSDNSDECGSHCSTSSQELLTHSSLKALSWVIGSLAVLLNSVTLVKFPGAIAGAKSLQGRMDKMLVLLVSTGDFMMGGYLLAIAATDRHYGTRYCTDKFSWLTSVHCNLLGVFSTLASQLSLFSMTVLSVSRLLYIKSVGRVSGSSRSSLLKLILVGLLLLLTSTLISCLPLLPQLEDFFVNGLFYHNVTLFSGIVDKSKHQQILRTYNGRYRNQAMSWARVRRLVSEMFSGDFGGIVGSKVEFYGNDGVCIFKYLVSQRDPQHLFSISILLVNFTCFLFITVSYLLIHSKSTKHSRKTKTKMSAAQRARQRKFQTKISVIIITDFLCWIPFIVVCGLHFFAVIDASPWYPIFSIIILPINSVINPVLYDDTLVIFCQKMFGKGTALISHSIYVMSNVMEAEADVQIVHSSAVMKNHVGEEDLVVKFEMTEKNKGDSRFLHPGMISNHGNETVERVTAVRNQSNEDQIGTTESYHGNKTVVHVDTMLQDQDEAQSEVKLETEEEKTISENNN